VSLGPILELAIASLHQHTATPAPGVTSAHLNSTGCVVVTLSNGDGYFYSPGLCAWQRLSEAWWAVGSQYWNSNDSSASALQSTAVGPVTGKNGTNGNGGASSSSDKPTNGSSGGSAGEQPAADISAGIIPFLERHTTNEFLLRGRAYALQRLVKALLARDGFEGFESSVSIAHLENRIAGALQLGARDEFRLYLFMYAKRIGAEGLRGKVEELLNSLLGGILQDPAGAGKKEQENGGSGSGVGWYSGAAEELCGWDRRELLRGVVMILGRLFLDRQENTASSRG
jgi:protein HIRA/HIR1